MGQKVHPEVLRVGYIHDWKSQWFDERNFDDYLLEDIRIREHIENKLAHAGLSSITIRKDKNEVEGAPQAEDEQARPMTGGRRGGAAAAGRSRRAAPARRSPDGDVTVRARAKYVRCAPRKARLVIDHIRGKDIADARAILLHTQRAAARDVLKVLDSAIANAENNHDLVADELRIGRAYVDEGPTLKRYRPRALGRATRIRKRTSHMTIELVAKE